MYLLISRLILLVFISLALSGCKLLVIVTNGGSVNANMASTNCAALTNCEFDIVDSTFVEDFEAIPNSGFQFVGWYDAPGFLCAGSTNPLCEVDNTILAGIVPDTIIADGPNLYAMAVFTDEAPIRDTVTAADGREWAQPFLFTNLSWNDINAVCSVSGGGVCTGSLKGWDMSGWVWGNASDLAALYNAYGVSPPLNPPFNNFTSGCATPWFDAFAADNWLFIKDNASAKFISGLIAEDPVEFAPGFFQALETLIFRALASAATCTGTPFTSDDFVVNTNFTVLEPSDSNAEVGAYFYKIP